MDALFDPGRRSRGAALLAGLQLLTAAAWCGVQWTVGYVVAPGLFAWAPDRVTAGSLAGRFFTVAGWTGIACAVLLLVLALVRGRLRSLMMLFALGMAACALALVLWLQPAAAALRAQAGGMPVQGSAIAAEFGRLHAVSSVVYLVESLLGVGLLLGWKRQA